MPGSVSDSYDPEFGTAANAERVREEIERLYSRLDLKLGPALPIPEVLDIDHDRMDRFMVSHRDLHLIRFLLGRALEDL